MPSDAVLAPNDTPASVAPQSRQYGDINIADDAKVHLGDNYVIHQNTTQTTNKAKKKSMLLSTQEYSNLNRKRDQLAIQGPVGKSFEWIENTTYQQWLHSKESIPFWIQGKPASGKSTLMRHLAQSKITLDGLRAQGDPQAWTIVYFFFDYRAGDNLANNLLGMLKLFLVQLQDIVPEIEQILENNERLLQMLKTDSQERYVDALSDIIRISQAKVCAFIDGLDEFDGDLWNLCTVLETIRTRTGMRMCLASRPERAFEINFLEAGFPTLTMQEHNAATISVHLTYKISQFQAEDVLSPDLFSEDLQTQIVEKAQGVILWAGLVIDEMLKACREGSASTTEDLYTFLDALPPDLEPLYERILNKTTPRYQGEIACVLHLITTNEKLFGLDDLGSTTVLSQALNYLQVTFLKGTILATQTSEVHHRKRLKGLLGNLIDVVNSISSFSEMPQVRLIHKTFSTYLARSKWIMGHLPKDVAEALPDTVWLRFAINMMSHTGPNSAVDIGQLLKFCDATPRQIRHRFIFLRVTTSFEHIQTFVSPHYRPWSYLILALVVQFYSLDSRKSLEESQSIRKTTILKFPSTTPNYARLHYELCSTCAPFHYWGWCQNSRMVSILREDLCHLVIEAQHGKSDALLEELPKVLKGSSPALRDLFDLILISDRNPAVLEEFQRNGYRVEGRHLCMTPALLRHQSRASVLLSSSQSYSSDNRSQVHDHECPDTKLSTGEHWLTLMNCDDEIFLKLIISIGIDLKTTFSKYGGLYHAILKLGDIADKAAHDRAAHKFRAAIRADIAPESGTLLSAKGLLWSANGIPISLKKGAVSKRTKKTKTTGPEYVSETSQRWSTTALGRQRYISFLTGAIEALEAYGKKKQWDDHWKSRFY